MNITAKVGTVLHVPMPSGWTLTSDNPACVSTSIASGVTTITVLKTGTAWLTLTPAADLQLRLAVNASAT